MSHGGGADGEGQALLTAMSLLTDGKLPGVWLLLSGWTPELNVDAGGTPTTEARCHALAVALLPAAANSNGLHLRIAPDFDMSDDADTHTPQRSSSWLSLLTTMLQRQPQKLNVVAPLCDGLRLQIAWHAAASATVPATPSALRIAG